MTTPPASFAEEAFALWCEERRLDETDEAWELYERWLDGDDD